MKSFVESANSADTDFPLANLPFGVFRRGEADAPRVGVAIGDRVLDLEACREAGQLAALDEQTEAACGAPDLNELMEVGDMPALRRVLQDLLGEHSTSKPELHEMRNVELLLPARIGDYTDFYASIHHATNVGSMFRPDNPLLPNYKWMPIGYHGRASSIVVSGTPVKRPSGQTRDDANQRPVFGPTTRLDYELELGVFIGRGNRLGEPIPVGKALEHAFGFCLVNDWSARDIQTWEYQPLGPFLAKSFATSVSPWVVTREALEPFRTKSVERDPAELPHLQDDVAYDITVEVWLQSAAMNEPIRVSRGNFRDMYWTVAQLIAHHASNGCNLRPGDLLASGTISGPGKDARGCLLELTWRGTEPLELPGGETRKFLEDGDEVILRAYCEREGLRVGFGECRGRVAG
jgi:fumarylacetoacetase